jgi:two-component system, OmpR family, sensor histidine kinase PhoQ
MRSVSQRLLISVTLLLLMFFGIMIVVLDARFRSLAQSSLRQLLETQIVALIATAEPDTEGYLVPRLQDAESRLATPGSGLYAAVHSSEGNVHWRSPSTVGSLVDFGPTRAPGQRAFYYLTDVRGGKLAAVSRGLRWEGDFGRGRDLTFTVAASLDSYNADLRSFRRGLLGSFGVLAVLLLMALALLLRWALSPLRRLAVQIHAVERGERERLDENWPAELRGVVTNLNTLLQAERTRIARYRDTMGNLAHSLKTPLAVLRTIVSGGGPLAGSVNTEVDRMSAIVAHQLRRAATSGGASVGKHAIAILPVAQDLRGAMLKVHAQKDYSLELQIAPEVLFVGDRDDLTEALGNVMDNASKWCRSRVRVSAVVSGQSGTGPRLHLVVEDDGPGIAATERNRVLERGERADEQTPGHGLGLAMVREMAELYGGTIELGNSPMGGARVELRLPGRLR